MSVGVVDIGTNSMRLLITDGIAETGRWVEVTGLGRGVDATGRLSEDAIDRTLVALGRFGELMDTHSVSQRAAMATSATRDAENRSEFLDRAEDALGVRPEVIAGDREGLLAFAGATAGLEGSFVVSDIGGGSTEFVTAKGPVSIDIGSVRLSDRILTDRPAPQAQIHRAFTHVRELFSNVDCSGQLVGVAGTWTSLGAIDLGLETYHPDHVHHRSMSRTSLSEIVIRLAAMTVAETEAIRSLDPGRAPVILSGALIAQCVMETVEADTVLISVHDTLDGLADELLDLT